MQAIKQAMTAAALLAAAGTMPVALAANTALTVSSSTYVEVPGDPFGQGTTYNNAPAPLLDVPMGNTATSALNNSRSGDNGYGRVGTSSAQDSTSATYGLLTAASTSKVTTLGNPFLEGDARTTTTSRFDDLATFYNPNFGPGVSFNVRLTMTVGFAGSVDANDIAGSRAIAQGGALGSITSYESASGNPRDDLPSWHDPLVQTLDFSVVNGQVVALFGSLTAYTEASLYNGYCDNCSTMVSAGIQAATVNYTLSGIDPGLELASASGYLYGVSAVPEPAAAWLLVIGVATVFGLRRAGATGRRRR